MVRTLLPSQETVYKGLVHDAPPARPDPVNHYKVAVLTGPHDPSLPRAHCAWGDGWLVHFCFHASPLHGVGRENSGKLTCNNRVKLVVTIC